MKEQPAFIAVLPANIRYCKQLSDAAKLLFAEITALSNKEGYCWANNNYFAELYGKSQRTISRIISDLEKNGFVNLDFESNETGTKRKIFPVVMGSQKCLGGAPKMARGVAKNGYHNNIINNISNNNTTNIGKNEFLQKKSALPLPSESSSLKNQKEEKEEKKVAPKKEESQLTEQQQRLLDEAKAQQQQPSQAEIMNTQKPEGVNDGVFHALRVFAATRQTKAKSKRMTGKAWAMMQKECTKASAAFAPDALIQLIELAQAREYQSPFFANYQKQLLELEKTNNHAITNQQQQPKQHSINNAPTTGEKLAGAFAKIHERNRRRFI